MSPASDQDVAEWRERGLRSLLRFSAIVMGLALLFFLPRNLMLGRYLLAAVMLAGAALIGVAAFAPRLSHTTRSALFALSIISVATTAVINAHTWTPNSFVAMATVTIVLSVTHSARAAWIFLSACVAIIVALASWFIFGGVQPLSDTADVTLPLNWIRIAVLFVPATAFGVLSVSRLVTHLEEALKQNRELIEREREQARRDTMNQEQQRLEALGRLAGGIAHDFNNVLLVMMANSELISRQSQDANIRDLASEIRDASVRGTELAKTLLTFGRAEAGEVGPVELNAAVSAALKVVHRLLPANQRFEFIPDERVKSVKSNAGYVGQVVMNLALNARDAMPNGGTITVRTRRDDDGFTALTVEDTGVGMDENTRRRAFEPYFTTRPQGRGSGLGLSTVHGVVVGQGGKVDLQSTPGKGTTVWWLSSDATPISASKPDRTVTPLPQKPLVLVVDDEPLSMRVISRVLASEGYETLTCGNGAEALRLWELNRDRVSLVVSDVLMPGMSGRELHDALELRAPKLPFLFCTGFSNDTLPIDLLSRPGRKLIAKPFTSETLMASVRALLNSAAPLVK
ncbi:MAG: response regulator [Archangium sp.]|nr:response regulator [Archangium sp.]